MDVLPTELGTLLASGETLFVRRLHMLWFHLDLPFLLLRLSLFPVLFLDGVGLSLFLFLHRDSLPVCFHRYFYFLCLHLLLHLLYRPVGDRNWVSGKGFGLSVEGEYMECLTLWVFLQ